MFPIGAQLKCQCSLFNKQNAALSRRFCSWDCFVTGTNGTSPETNGNSGQPLRSLESKTHECISSWGDKTVTQNEAVEWEVTVRPQSHRGSEDRGRLWISLVKQVLQEAKFSLMGQVWSAAQMPCQFSVPVFCNKELQLSNRDTPYVNTLRLSTDW